LGERKAGSEAEDVLHFVDRWGEIKMRLNS
jgi:hypothetical protein